MHDLFLNSEAHRDPNAAHRLIREAATDAGLWLDSCGHGDVAVLHTKTVELMFLAGVPAAYFDKRSKQLFVADALQAHDYDWHRLRIELYWRSKRWNWVAHDVIFAALACRLDHEPKCRRAHFQRCTRPHLRKPSVPKPAGEIVT